MNDAKIFEDQTLSPPLSKAEARRRRKAEKAKKFGSVGGPIIAKSATQKAYLSSLQNNESIFCIGPAGTGKSYLAARVAAKKLLDGSIGKIVVCRVTVADKKHALGFLPGKQDQKLAPWVVPIMDGLKAEMGAAMLDKLRLEGRIEVAAFETLRGRTFSDCSLIFDEAQNAATSDLKLLLTRIGENCQVVVTGDLDQVDVKDSGLQYVINLGRMYGVPMAVHEFTEDDVVRSEFTKAWVKAFNSDGNVKILDQLPAFIHNARKVALRT